MRIHVEQTTDTQWEIRTGVNHEDRTVAGSVTVTGPTSAIGNCGTEHFRGRLGLPGRAKKIHERVCRYGGHVPIRGVWRARTMTGAVRWDPGLSGTPGTRRRIAMTCMAAPTAGCDCARRSIVKP